MTPQTKATALRAMQQRASDLRDIIASHLKGEAQRAYEAWRTQQTKEARLAEVELHELEQAMLEMELL